MKREIPAMAVRMAFCAVFWLSVIVMLFAHTVAQGRPLAFDISIVLLGDIGLIFGSPLGKENPRACFASALVFCWALNAFTTASLAGRIAVLSTILIFCTLQSVLYKKAALVFARREALILLAICNAVYFVSLFLV